MNCWHCKTELIWGGDHDIDDDEEHSMVTNLSCPECESYVLVYYPREKEDEENDI
jgi:RNase P subunit RPR2